mmetsp:Transcript_33952/g.83910  ORF Transcript_33952/g.83910 Transcript_33952/m.83910 type:complete len:230 (+) Transcript_33952:1298-1987(+)
MRLATDRTPLPFITEARLPAMMMMMTTTGARPTSRAPTPPPLSLPLSVAVPLPLGGAMTMTRMIGAALPPHHPARGHPHAWRRGGHQHGAWTTGDATTGGRGTSSPRMRWTAGRGDASPRLANASAIARRADSTVGAIATRAIGTVGRRSDLATVGCRTLATHRCLCAGGGETMIRAPPHQNLSGDRRTHTCMHSRNTHTHTHIHTHTSIPTAYRQTGTRCFMRWMCQV